MRGPRVLLCLVLLLPGTAAADQIELPTPDAAQLAATQLLRQLPGFRPDRLLPSDVPGPVVNDEVVHVGLGGDGGVRRVLVDQRLRLQGTGDYAVRERGPAREARSLTEDPAPVTRKGGVVWQGFSPGSRDLAARLLMDPQIEAQHLPLAVSVRFRDASGAERGLEPGGAVPGPGTVTVTVRNVTEQPAVLPTGSDADPSPVAAALDRAREVARHPSAARLPDTEHGLPARLDVEDAAREQGAQAVPFRLTGSLEVHGTNGTVTGPSVRAVTGGATFAGVLGGTGGVPEVSFTAQVGGAGDLALSLQAIAVLDARTLEPPDGARSWRAWAASSPPRAERKAALDLLVQVAATGARASSYSPYLGADLTGKGSTRFEYAFAPPERVAAVRPQLEPRWGAIALASLALLLLLGNASLIWRRL